MCKIPHAGENHGKMTGMFRFDNQADSAHNRVFRLYMKRLEKW